MIMIRRQRRRNGRISNLGDLRRCLCFDPRQAENRGKTVADQENVKPSAGGVFRAPALVRTVPEVPVIFADGLINEVMGPGVAKFHFFRSDAIVGDQTSYEKVEVLQVIMPANAFVDMVAFFEHRIRVMLKNNNVSKELVEERREFYSKYPV
jgi:hypothetical protein